LSFSHRLWKSDGTEAGTALVRDIITGAPSSSPNQMAGLDGTLLFAADDGANGYELWKSDGSETGTVLVKDINPGGGDSSPIGLTPVNG
jgi:ELWxxDGT repeat protein